MVWQGRWSSWPWQPGERGGGEGGSPGKLVINKQIVPMTGITGQSQAGLVAQSKVIWFPVSPATKEEQGSGKLRNKLCSRKFHAMFESTKETLAYRLRQIRPLRFPGCKGDCLKSASLPCSPPKAPDLSQIPHVCDKSPKGSGKDLELGSWLSSI